VNFGYRSWKNAGPKFVVVMKQPSQELALKLSTILMEPHVNNFKFMISICISRKKCFGKCLLKQILTGIQLLVQLILPRDAIQKQLKSLACVIFIHTLCSRLDLFSSKKEVKTLDICCNLETHGEIKNGWDHGVIIAALGKLTNTLTDN
jgi:hypothetical protein